MDKTSWKIRDTEAFTSGYYGGSQVNNDNESNNEDQSNMNLRSKLTNAFTDLESLRKTLKDIRSNNDNFLNKRTNKNNAEKYDFFSDERYANVLNQIKQSNIDHNKLNKTVNNNYKSASSKEKLTSKSFIYNNDSKDAYLEKSNILLI